MGSLDGQIRSGLGALADFEDQQSEQVLAEAMRKGRQRMRRRAVVTRVAVVVAIGAAAAGILALVLDQGGSDTVAAAGDGSAVSVPMAGTSPSSGGQEQPGGPATTPADNTSVPSTTASVPVTALDDGQPPDAWVGISAAGELERFATDTNEAVESFGPLDSGQNRVVAAWSRPGSATIYAAVCCEPAGGLGYKVGPEIPLSDRYTAFSGFAAVPSADGRLIAVPQTTGLFVSDPDSQEAGAVVSDTGSDRSTAVAWLPSGRTVAWMPVKAGKSDVVEVVSLDDALRPTETRRLPIPPVWEPSLAAGRDGKLLVVGCAAEVTGGACSKSKAIELDPAAGTWSDTPIEPGSRLGGYDPTGRFLLYVDGTGAVHLRSGNENQVVANGYSWASW